MSWFHFTKLERLKRNREIRREHADAARKEAADNVFTIQRTIKDALKLAHDEEKTFPDYFGEQMPDHVASALRLEIALWQHLEEAIETADVKKMSEADYDQWKERIRSFLLHIVNLLHAEEEMVTSCLVRHYINIIHAIQAEVARVTI